MFLFNPKTSNIAINIKEIEIKNIQNGYSAGNTLRLPKLEAVDIRNINFFLQGNCFTVRLIVRQPTLQYKYAPTDDMPGYSSIWRKKE